MIDEQRILWELVPPSMHQESKKAKIRFLSRMLKWSFARVENITKGRARLWAAEFIQIENLRIKRLHCLESIKSELHKLSDKVQALTERVKHLEPVERFKTYREKRTRH